MLSPAQFVLFWQEWKNAAAILAMDNIWNNIAVSSDMLTGEGLFVTIAQQITIPRRGLAQVADIVRAAWLKNPSQRYPFRVCCQFASGSYRGRDGWTV